MSAEMFEAQQFGKHDKWENAVAQGGAVIRLLRAALDNPPTTLEDIESFLVNIRARATRETHERAQAALTVPPIIPAGTHGAAIGTWQAAPDLLTSQFPPLMGGKDSWLPSGTDPEDASMLPGYSDLGMIMGFE